MKRDGQIYILTPSTEYWIFFFFYFSNFWILHGVTIPTLHDIAGYYVTINYKYITLHYTTNFNGKVTIQKKKRKIRSKYRRHSGTESKGRAQFLLSFNLSILLVLTHLYFSVSYLILTVDEKAVMTGRVWFLLQPHKYSLAISIK